MYHSKSHYRQLFLAAILILVATVGRAADDCVNKASYALQQIAGGDPYNLDILLESCSRDPNAFMGLPYSSQGRPSKNIPPAIHAVLYNEVCKQGPVNPAISNRGLPVNCGFYETWFANYFQDQEAQGLMDVEVFSPIYLNPIVASSLVAYKVARENNHASVTDKARRWLRSFWAISALMARPGDINRDGSSANSEVVVGFDSSAEQGSGTWAGITVAHAGTRPQRGFPPMALHSSNLHHMLSLALDYKGANPPYRSLSRQGLNRPEFATASTGIATMVQLSPELGFNGNGSISNYAGPTPASAFGLTLSERSALNALIKNPSPTAVDQVLGMVDHPINQCEMSIVRTTRGMAVWLGGFDKESRGRLCNPDSGGFLAVSYDSSADTATVLAPAHAPHNRKTWDIYRDGNQLCAESGTTKRCISFPEGDELYALTWDQNGLRRAAGHTPDETDENCTARIGSELVSIDIPDEVICGERVEVTVTMRNRGTQVWHTSHTQSPAYSLRVDQGYELMNSGFADFPDVEVGCNETYTFTFALEPDLGGQSGIIRFAGSMVEESPGGQDHRDDPIPPSDPDPFGARFEKDIFVNCTAPYAARLVDLETSGPTTIECGGAAFYSVTYENIGSLTWKPADQIRMGTPGFLNQNSPFPELRRSGLTREVKPGESYTFDFEVNAAGLAEGADAQSHWQLIVEAVPQWFGEVYDNNAVVTCSPPPPEIECIDFASMAQDDSFEVYYEIPSILDVLANDTSPSGTPLFIGSFVQNDCGGQVSVEGGGQWISFLPPLETLGNCTMRYDLKDESGETLDNATVRIEILPTEPPGPRITAEPADVSAPLGGTAVFSVAVTEFQTVPIYQWYHRDQPVGTNSPTLVLNNLQPLDAGVVYCTVSGDNLFENLRSRDALLTVTPVASQQAPYVSHNLVGPVLTVEAEHFDLGGPGVAYEDRTLENLGDDPLRLSELASVDLAKWQGGSIVGWNQPGEWLEYTLNVPAETVVQLNAEVASISEPADPPAVSVYLNGQQVADQVALPPTGGWSLFQTRQIINQVTVPAGTVVMRIAVDRGPFNLDKLVLAENTGLLITQQPQPLTLEVGQTATFAVSVAGGQPPYAYTWRKDGGVLNDTTRITGSGSATLAVSGLVQGDFGDYDVTIVDALGNSRQSSQARLVVTTGTQGEQAPYQGIATAIPGSRDAWQFDDGGHTVSHFDLTMGDAQPPAERADDWADIAVNRSAGPKVISDFGQGEWLEYTVFAPSATVVDFWTTASAPTGGQLEIRVNGQLQGSLTVPNAQGADLWDVIKLANLSFGQGQHLLQIKSVGQDISLDRWGTVPGGMPLQQPHPGNPHLLSGSRIQAEYFDLGGREIAYRDATNVNDCAGALQVCRSEEDVNLNVNQNGEAFVTRTQAGEWLEYTLSLNQAATVDLEFRVSGASGGFTLQDEFGNDLQSVNFTKPAASGTLYSVRVTDLNLLPVNGKVTLRLHIDQGNFNFYWFRYDQPDLEPFAGVAVNLPTGEQNYIEAEHFDVRLDGSAEGLTYFDTTLGNSQQSVCGGTRDCHPGESVDIGHWTQSGIKFIQDIESEEWLAYTVATQKSGPFIAKYAVAGEGSLCLADETGRIIPESCASFSTGGLSTFSQATSDPFHLPISSGETRIRVVFEPTPTGNSILFNRFRILEPTPEPPAAPVAVDDIRIPEIVAALVDDGGNARLYGVYEFEIDKLFENDLPKAPEANLSRIVRYPNPDQGTLEISADGSKFIFSKKKKWAGDSFDFDYRMTANNQISNVAKAEILLETTGLIPLAQDDGPYYLAPLNEVRISKSQLMRNDEGHFWHDFTAPTHGTLEEEQNELVYTPFASFTTGEDTFTYRSKVSHDSVIFSNEATVTLEIGGANIVLRDDVVEMPYQAEDIQVERIVPAYMKVLSRILTANDEPGGNILGQLYSTPSTQGSVIFEPGAPGNSAVRYLRPEGLGEHAIAEDVFQYVASPANQTDPAQSAAGTVTVRIFPSPVAVADVLALNIVQGETLEIPSSALLPNDEAFERNLTIHNVRPGNAANVDLLIDGSIAVTAPAEFTGTLTFEYQLTNDFYEDNDNKHWKPVSNWATVSLQVIPVPPVLSDDGPLEVVFGGPRRFTRGDLVSNDTHGGNVSFEACHPGPGFNGTLVCETDAIEYRPNPGYVGPDSFTYTLRDEFGSVSANEATVTVQVLPPTVQVVRDSVELPPTHFDHYDLPATLFSKNDQPQGEIQVSGLLTSDRFLAQLAGNRVLLTPDMRFFETGKGFLDYLGHHILTDAVTAEARAEIFLNDTDQTLFADSFTNPNHPQWSSAFETISGAILPFPGEFTVEVNATPEDGIYFNEDLETLGHNAYLKGHLEQVQDHVWLSFELDTSALQIQEGHLLTILRAGFLHGQLLLRQTGNNLEIAFAGNDNHFAPYGWNFVTLPSDRTQISLEWFAADPGQNNGGFRLWLDGTLADFDSDVATDGQSIDRFDLGVIASLLTAGQTGSVSFRHFSITRGSRQTETFFEEAFSQSLVSPWTFTQQGGGSLEVIDDRLVVDLTGASPSTQLFVSRPFGEAESHVFYSLRLDMATLVTQSSAIFFPVFQALGRQGSAFTLYARQVDGVVEVALVSRLDDGSNVGWQWQRVPWRDGLFTLETKASGLGEADGYIRLWQDGFLVSEMDQLANSKAVMDRVRLGALWGFQTGQQSGILALDDLSVWRGDDNRVYRVREDFEAATLSSNWLVFENGLTTQHNGSFRVPLTGSGAAASGYLWTQKSVVSQGFQLGFDLDLTDVSLTTQNVMAIAQSSAPNGRAFFQIHLAKSDQAGMLKIRIAADTSDRTRSMGDWFEIPKANHAMGIVMAAEDIGMANGSAQLFVDGQLASQVSSLANAQLHAKNLFLGAVWGLGDQAQSGTLIFDNVLVWDLDATSTATRVDRFNNGQIDAPWVVGGNSSGVSESGNKLRFDMNAATASSLQYVQDATPQAAERYRAQFEIDLRSFQTTGPQTHFPIFQWVDEQGVALGLIYVRQDASGTALAAVARSGDGANTGWQYGNVPVNEALNLQVIWDRLTQTIQIYHDGNLISAATATGRESSLLDLVRMGPLWGFSAGGQSGEILFDNFVVWP